MGEHLITYAFRTASPDCGSQTLLVPNFCTVCFQQSGVVGEQDQQLHLN